MSLVVVASLAAACAVLKLPRAVANGVSAAVKFAAEGEYGVTFQVGVKGNF